MGGSQGDGVAGPRGSQERFQPVGELGEGEGEGQRGGG